MNETLVLPLVALTIGSGIVTSMFLGGLVPGTFPYLSKQIRSLNKQERLSAALGLGRLGGQKATTLLSTLLNHHELEMRRVAVESLAMTKDPTVIEPLGSVLDDSSPLIRRAVAIGLASFDHPRATEFLCQAIKDSDEQVVAAAAVALAHRKDPAAIEPLCRALSASSEVAAVVSKALVSYGMEAFETLCRLLPDAGAVTGERMIEIMRDIDPAAAIEPLVQTLSTARAEATVKAAIRALTALKPPGLVETLSRQLPDPSALAREAAIQALSELNQPEGVTAIAQVLRDPSPSLRCAAVLALAGRPDPGVIGALCTTLADQDPEVVRLAAQALGAHHDSRIVRSFFQALYPDDCESVTRSLEESLKRPLDQLSSALDFLPVLERWAGPNARQDDQTARYFMQSALILLHGRAVRGFRDLTSTVIVFKGREWTSMTREDRLHPLAAEALDFLPNPREVRQFQASKSGV